MDRKKVQVEIKRKESDIANDNPNPNPNPIDNPNSNSTPNPTSVQKTKDTNTSQNNNNDIGFFPFGKYIPIKDINQGMITESTWGNYIKFIRKIYPLISLPVEESTINENFYWERISYPKVIEQIQKVVLENYQIKDGNALSAKLSPFRAIMMRISHLVPREVTEIWNNVIIDSRKNFDMIISDLNVTPYVPPAKRDLPNTWSEAYKSLSLMANSRSVDPRVRILAHLYRYGYIMRMNIIFRTYIQEHSDNLIPADIKEGTELAKRYNSNSLNVKDNYWLVNKEGTICRINVNPKLVEDIYEILKQHKIFEQGWILPRKNGSPYSADASVSSFSSWTNLGLSTYTIYRKLYLNWISKSFSERHLHATKQLLDTTSVLIDTYPPVPK